MFIHWFKPTANGILYILPAITYIATEAYRTRTDMVIGKAIIINFVWLYWTTFIILPYKQN